MLRRKSLYCVLVANTYVIIYGCTLSRTIMLVRGWPRSWIDKHKTRERPDFSTRNVRRPSITHVGRERFTIDEARGRGTLLQYYTEPDLTDTWPNRRQRYTYREVPMCFDFLKRTLSLTDKNTDAVIPL